MQQQKNDLIQKLKHWNVQCEGDWTYAELERISKVFHILSEQADVEFTQGLFKNQPTTLIHSGLPGKAGRTQGGKIYLDDDWTNWTFAHELGHRWNNAWDRLPENILRLTTNAGRWEWLKRALRRFEKWLERMLKHFKFQGRLDWQSLWYAPGDAPPPCGIDRNFNASEDLAESFASIIYPSEAKARANAAAARMLKFSGKWDWGNNFDHFLETPRGKTTLQTIRTLLPDDKRLDNSNHTTGEDQPGRV